jgi:threonine/homoserine/homoserine lactone efflux protein
MDTFTYIRHVIRQATNYTFSRITFYLTIFNFFMLASWMYESTSVGDWMKENHLRAGDMMAIILFIIFAISALEYVVLGRDKGEEEQ